ncbi:MAG: hypothetical protein AMJ60_07705 [Desulfobacterales bacterium SG8_35]|nr:MAG: hypothetical protein AMJ60_07705 [Desulfobacterales bacterium SG8_35]
MNYSLKNKIMSESKNQLLKLTLALYAVITLLYGITYLFFPNLQIKMAGGEPIEPGWIRWFGGVLLALGIGSIMVIRNPVKQGIYVTAMCIGSFLVSLSLIYEVIVVDFEEYNLSSTLIPAIVLFLIGVLFWMSLRKSKDILW